MFFFKKLKKSKVPCLYHRPLSVLVVMKKMNNIEFESLLQNEDFIRLMKEDTQKARQMVDDLCLNNPENENEFRMAVLLLKRYQAEKTAIEEEKISVMWNNVLQKSANTKKTRTFHFTPMWRVAASVAILLSLSVYLYWNFNDQSIRRLADQKVAVTDVARIIISDGSEYPLRENDSHIRYGADGKEIVIEEKNSQTEKLSNEHMEAKAVYNQIVVPYGKRHSITLSDGTVVQLNSGSKLVFPAKFADAKREVFLKGEGYFEVAKEAQRPFIVSTDFMSVKVLGTHFNISAYENEKSATAVLVEGSVEVYKNNLFRGGLCKIKPGQGCFFTENEPGLKVQNVDVNEYVSWKDGFFQFKDQPLGLIIKKVEKYYNKSIIINDNELAHRMISGKLVLADSIDKTMDFLARTTKSKYSIANDGAYIFEK